MLMIAGYTEVDPGERDEAVAIMRDLVTRACDAAGCLDVAWRGRSAPRPSPSDRVPMANEAEKGQPSLGVGGGLPEVSGVSRSVGEVFATGRGDHLGAISAATISER